MSTERRIHLGRLTLVEETEDIGEILSQYPKGGNIFGPINVNSPQNRFQAAIAEAFKRGGTVIVDSQQDCKGIITTRKLIEE